MSASREKRKRQETKSNNPGLSAKEQQQRKDNFRRRIAITVAVVVVLGLFLLIFTGSGIPQANFTAMSVGGVKVTAAEYDYYYLLNQYQIVSLYAQYGLIDTTVPLKEQQYSEDQTWADYIGEQTVSAVQNAIALSEQAKAEGIALTDEDKATIESDIATLQTTAANSGMDTDKYLRENFGRGMSLDTYRTIVERGYLASRYQTVKVDSFDRSDEKINEYYNENKDTYDKIDYHLFSFTMTPPAKAEGEDPYTEEELADFKAEQKAKADDMLSRVTTADAFKALSLEFTDPPADSDTTDDDTAGDDTTDDDTTGGDTADDDEAEEEETDTTFVSVTASSVTAGVLSEYMLDASRKEGDKAVLEDTASYYVVLYLKRWRDEEKTVNIRHILISLDDYPDDKDGAKAKAEEVYQEWKDGEATEDSFVELAKTNSADGNAADGGIYENVYKGQMVAPFEDWCFDPARKTGDSGIVETEYGFHIMYFISDDDAKWKTDVIAAMDNEEYTAWLEPFLAENEPRKNWFGMLFTGTAL
ncbi:MAG: peptidylprolyl isomerase [Oscillospiraceae bacterium]|jgi:hypothetical protein|nr:peptidylprolyl isomerase [Oscillospiraceae bacterium]